MVFKRYAAVFVTILACSPLTLTAQELLLNGGFESATTQGVGSGQGSELGTSNYTSANGGFGQVGTAGVANWNASGSRLWYMTDLGGGTADFPNGNYAARIDARGDVGGIEVLSQSGLNLNAGVAYEFEIDVWGEAVNGLLDAALTGPETIQFFDDQSFVGNDGDFDTLTALITPTTSGMFSLELSSPNNGNNHVWVDNVSLVATPEPTSIAIWTLLALALGGYGYARMRRRK